MKTCIIRKLVTLPCIHGASTIVLPVSLIPCRSPVIPFFDDVASLYSHQNLGKRKNGMMRKHSTHRGTSARESKQKSPERPEKNTDVIQFNQWRNFSIICYRIHRKASLWEQRLYWKFMLLLSLYYEADTSPDDNKELSVEIKKLERSFFDSYEAYENFSDSINPFTSVPSEPLYDEFCISEDFYEQKNAKRESKRHYKNVDKKFKSYRRKARRNKQIEREFWLSQWEDDSEMTQAKTVVSDGYNEFLEAEKNLIAAEKDLSNPCIEQAAWAIYEGTVEENFATIEEAEKIMYTYQLALERYEIAIGAVPNSGF